MLDPFAGCGAFARADCRRIIEMPGRVPEQTPEEVARFAASVAHDLNNLLQVVNGNLEIIAARLEDERLRGYLNNAMIAAQQITDLARGLYDEPMESLARPSPVPHDGGG
jgi:signal transduction histidine kinase